MFNRAPHGLVSSVGSTKRAKKRVLDERQSREARRAFMRDAPNAPIEAFRTRSGATKPKG